MNARSEQAQRLALRLQKQGPSTGRSLAATLRISQPTLSRLMATLSDQVIRLGATRSTSYALRRTVRHYGNSWPLYRIDAEGRPLIWAQLNALHGGYLLVPKGSAPSWLEPCAPFGFFTELPFFLRDIRPHGFIGRNIARRSINSAGTPEEPSLWQEDDILAYLLTEGVDTPGDFILGDRALEAWLRNGEVRAASTVDLGDRENAYPHHADEATRGFMTGPSAGGEQAKFLCSVSTSLGGARSVLVKFTTAGTSVTRQRWADLLACEHLASEVLREKGEACARTQLLDSGGRRFLEVARFDRVGAGGRRGIISLEALERGFLREIPDDWMSSAFLLEKKGLLSAEDAARLRRLSCFGDLIANSHMTKGNISVSFGEAAPFSLSPAYDMLPMLFAPSLQGELVDRLFSPRPPLPAHAADWVRMVPLALEFWRRVQSDERISASFKEIAGGCAERVQSLHARFG